MLTLTGSGTKKGPAGGGGFTLIEITIATAVLAIVGILMYGVIGSLYKSWVSEGLKADMRQNARAALDTVTKDIEMAGFQVTMYGDVNKSNLAITLAAVDEIEFDQQQLRIEDGSYQPRMFYYHLATDAHTGRKNLYRQLRTQPGLAAPDEIVAENITSFSLSYFDADGAPVTGLPLAYVFGNPPPPTLLDIRKICVAVTAKTDRTPPAAAGPGTMSLSACVTPRNLTVEETALDAAPPATPTGLAVADTGSCSDKLCVRWDKSPETDLAGYTLHYGVGAKTVPVTSLADQENPRTYLNTADIAITKNSSRLLTPNVYTISISAYDSSGNHSTQSSPVSGNPGPGSDERDCTGGTVTDTTVNPLPPSPPENLTVTPGAERELVVTWSPPADGSATAGYRLYRSETQFTDNALIDVAYLIADESDLTAGVTTYTDTGLVGCKTYYYAVSSINCDETLASGYLFEKNPDRGDYAKANGEPEDLTPPPATSLVNTKAGWQRIFLDFANPLDEEVSDFNRTEIYFNAGANCPSLQPGGNVSGGSLIPDNDSGTPGTFVLPGSQTVIFDDHSSPTPPPPGDPTLNNQGQYCLLSIAYDDCENTALDSSSQVLIALCGDDPPGPPPEWPVNPTYTSCDPEWVKLTWEYPPKNYVPPDQVYDFAGYRLWRTGPEPAIEIELTDGPTWNETWTDGKDLQEGGQYRYTVRATDCVYENNPAVYPTNYSTALFIPSSTGWLAPGKLTLFRGDTGNPLAPENFVSTISDAAAPFTHHNNVRFFLENTSQSSMTIEMMRFAWENPNVVLESVAVGGPPSVTPVTVTSAGGVLPGTDVAMNTPVYDVAVGPGQPSVAVPVVLRFTNTDGSVNRFTDMRSEEMVFAMQVRNDSLQQSTCDLQEFILEVPPGPSIGRIVQDWPAPYGSPCYEVVGLSGSARDDDLKVPALVEVNVNALAYDNSGLLAGGTSLGFDTLSVFTASSPVLPLAETPAMPTGVSFAELPLQHLTGNQYAIFHEGSGAGAKMPVGNDSVAWYYLLAVDPTGNFDRFPNPDFGACAYYQKPSDPCTARPKPPTLGGVSSPTAVDLSWSPPTENVDGSPVAGTTSLLYDVYVSIDGAAFTLLAADLATQTYSHTADITAASYAYRVVAKNNCLAGALESDPSAIYRECEGESSINCDDFTVPSVAAIENAFTITARNLCTYALNGTADTVTFEVAGKEDHQYLSVTETGDTGTFVKSIIPTECESEDRRTYLSADIDTTVSVIPLTSIHCIPAYGTVEIGNERISYSAVSGSALTGAVRGAEGTTAAPHSQYRRVYYRGGGPGNFFEVDQGETLSVELRISGSTVCTTHVTISDPCGDVPRRPNPFSVTRGASNEEALLTWGPPTYNTNGSPALDLGGYQIEITRCKDPDASTCSDWSPWETVDIPDPAADNFTVTGLQSRRTGFRMRAYDTCRTSTNFSWYTDTLRQ